jgi:DNA-binding CsgD family transcriptional regulator
LFFGVAFAVEDANRITVILVGAAIFATALMGRLYAAGLDSALARRGHIRPTVRSWGTSATVHRVNRSPDGVRSLTRRELEVARLAAEGYTAAEVGRRLHIGDRTVESHLGAAYSKLGISSRLQLIRMASRLGAPP